VNEILLSVVLPAYNETHRLPRTLSEIRPYLDENFRGRYEVVVSDDGSTDHTVETVLEAGRDWPELRCLHGFGHAGKGATVKRGCLNARGRCVLVMDADHCTPIDTVSLMMPLLTDHDMVAGVRTFCGEEGSSGRFRRIVGLMQQLLAHLVVFQKSVADSQCGFKMFKREAARELFSRSRIRGGMFDVELFFIAHKLGLKIFSKPVKWVNKEGSTINIPRCMIFDPLSLLAIRFYDWIGGYR
jgi:dolichyl-phosphate beta-glucosyltransferase